MEKPYSLEEILKLYSESIALVLSDLGFNEQEVQPVLEAAGSLIENITGPDPQVEELPPNPNFDASTDSFENAIFTFVVHLTKLRTAQNMVANLENPSLQARQSVIDYLTSLCTGLQSLNESEKEFKDG